MKIKANKQIIESLLINLQPFLEKKDASQITSHILFKTNNDKCIVKATDSEIGLKIITDNITVEEEGAFTANGKKLLDIIRILKDDEITLEKLDDTLVIKQKNSKFKLPTFDANAYPSFPTIENKPQITLDSLTLIQNLKKISPAIDTNNPKFELNGALINIKNNSTDLVGTDTRRLAIASIEGNNSEEISIIIPKKAILEIQKLFLDEINIHFDETNLIISNENYFFYTRLINGKFPDYQRIIPSSTKFQIVLPKKEMIEAIKMITTISQEIKMILLSNAIIFESLSADNIEAKTEIEVDTGLDDKFEISFNSKYLLDFISQINTNDFVMECNESSLPFIVKDNNFITIIMPIVA
ncbi:MAG: DNA polymerase III subunit beta [Sulfurovum sp.]|nr:MAG: DNA polymerase III subunit beta [Sulfurovum sp.]RUM71813.1 MAG: DNA polymerase III subunit beta [Sulfurovum sp.]